MRAPGALLGLSHSRFTLWRKSRRRASRSTFERVRSNGLDVVVVQARLAGSKTNVGTSSARDGLGALGACRVKSFSAHRAPRKAGEAVLDFTSSAPFGCCTHNVRYKALNASRLASTPPRDARQACVPGYSKVRTPRRSLAKTRSMFASACNIEMPGNFAGQTRHSVTSPWSAASSTVLTKSLAHGCSITVSLTVRDWNVIPALPARTRAQGRSGRAGGMGGAG